MTKQRTPPPLHYVVWRSQPGGAESSVKYYVDRFTGRRDLFLYSLRTSANAISPDASLHFESGDDRNWRCYLLFFRYCRRHRSGLFHLISTGPLTLLLALLAGVRNPVYHIHGTIYWKGAADRLYLKALWRLNSLFAVTYIANSAYSAAIFRKKVLAVRSTVIYNGFLVEQFLKKRFLRTGLRRMAYIGRLHPGKNVELVLRLFEAVAGEMPGLELHIAGDGMLRAPLEAQARNSPYGDRIVFHGWVSDMAAFYQSVDLFVFLSAFESFGNVLIEALLTGLPILTSDVPVFNEIHGGETAFLLGDPEAYDAVEQTFRQAIADFPLLAQKAYALGGHLGETFSMQRHLDAVEHAYSRY